MSTKSTESTPSINPEFETLKEACRNDLYRFCREVFPELFYKPFTLTQTNYIAALEKAIIHGEHVTIPTRRQSGLTTIINAAVCFAVGYGYCRYPVVIHESDSNAKRVASSIKRKLVKHKFDEHHICSDIFPEAADNFTIAGRGINSSFMSLTNLIKGEFNHPDFIFIDSCTSEKIDQVRGDLLSLGPINKSPVIFAGIKPKQ
jgi:hypothetical protein